MSRPCPWLSFSLLAFYSNKDPLANTPDTDMQGSLEIDLESSISLVELIYGK